MKGKTGLYLIGIFLAVIFLYKDSFNGNFFQDDWFSLLISRVSNLKDFLSFFIPRTDVIYYRPLGMQLPFFLIQNIFGARYNVFQFFIYSIHFVNIYLVYCLIKKLSNNYLTALLSSFLYGISLIHYILFYWPATISFVLAPFLFLSSFIFFIISDQTKRKYQYVSLILFLIGCFTNEILIVLPLILIGYSWLYDRKKIRRSSYFLLVSVVFLLLRFIFFSPATSGLYQIKLSSYFFNNLEGYLLWSMNWPEELKAQLVNFYTINPLFIRDFYIYYVVFVFSLLVNILLLYVLPLISIIYYKIKVSYPKIILGLSWFIIGLLPVIFFDKHSFSYYLPISYIGLLFFSISLFVVLLQLLKKHIVIKCLFILLLLINSVITVAFGVNFNSKVHWAPRRSLLSKDLIREAMKNYQNEGKVYIKSTSENRLSLNNQDAFKVLFGSNVVTIYSTESREMK